MKICQINCVYGIGSTGKITRDIHLTLLEQGYDSIVITPLSNRFTDDYGVFVVSNKFLSYLNAALKRILGMQFDWAHIQTLRIVNILKKENPDVVHLQCINGNDINIYHLLRFLAKHNVKTLYTLHAEFPFTGGCGNSLRCLRWKNGCGNCPLHKGKIVPIFDGTHRTWLKQNKAYGRFKSENLHFTAVSPWLLNRAEEAKMLIPFNKNIVMNGVDTNIFQYSQEDSQWKNKLGIKQNEKILLYVTASFFPHTSNLKGGKYILDLARRFENDNVKIIVAANYGDTRNLPNNIIYIGRTKTQQDLATLYSEANLSIITSQSETFGMPVAESLCCGTPIVGFKAGGPESVAIPEFSEFVTYGDVNALYHCVCRWLMISYDKSIISSQAITIFSKNNMTHNYIDQYISFAGK